MESDIPGYYYDPDTRRYYLKSNCPLEFLQKLKSKKQKADNEKLISEFTSNKKFCSKPDGNINIVSALRQRQIGANLMQFKDALCPMYSTHLHKIGNFNVSNLDYGPKFMFHTNTEPSSSIYIGHIHSDRRLVKISPTVNERKNSVRFKVQTILLDGVIRNCQFCFPHSTFVSNNQQYSSLHGIGTYPNDKTMFYRGYFFDLERDNIKRINLDQDKREDFVRINRSTIPFYERYQTLNDSPFNAFLPNHSNVEEKFFDIYSKIHLEVFMSCLRPRSGKRTYRNDRLRALDVVYDCNRLNPVPLSCISAYNNGNVRVAIYQNEFLQNEVIEERCHTSTIRDVRFLKNGVQFVASGDESFLKLFDIRRLGQPVLSYQGHKSSHHVHRINISDSTNLLVSSGSDNLVRFWNLTTGKLVNYINDRTLAYRSPFVDEYPIQAYYVDQYSFNAKYQRDALFLLHANSLSVYSSKMFNSDSF